MIENNGLEHLLEIIIEAFYFILHCNKTLFRLLGIIPFYFYKIQYMYKEKDIFLGLWFCCFNIVNKKIFTTSTAIYVYNKNETKTLLHIFVYL